jgi:1-acyl-sn-glycerol-3-phosphate acyltransferase
MSAATDDSGKTRHRRQDFYVLRFLCTGLAFFSFGFFGLMFRIVVYPPLLLLTPEQRQPIARALIRGFFRAFVRLLRISGAMTLHIDHPERLQAPGTLIAANHPSLIDVVVLVSLIPDACCIVKESLWSNAFMKGPLRAAGYIPNSDPESMFAAAVRNLRAGSAVVIFPEGTRTERGGRPVFGRSAANLSVRGGAPLLPVHISVDPTTLTRNEPWYEVPYRRVRFRLSVGSALDPRSDPATAQVNEPVTLKVRRQQARLEDFMNTRLAGTGAADQEQQRPVT